MALQQTDSQVLIAKVSEYTALLASSIEREQQSHGDLQRQTDELKATIKESAATIEILKSDMDSDREFSNFRAKCFLDKEKHSLHVIENLRTELGSYLKHLSNAKAAAAEQKNENILLTMKLKTIKANGKKVISNIKGVNKQLNDCITTRDRKIGELNDYIDFLHNVLQHHSIFEDQGKKRPSPHVEEDEIQQQPQFEDDESSSIVEDEESSLILGDDEDQQESYVEDEQSSPVVEDDDEDQQECYVQDEESSPIVEDDEDQQESYIEDEESSPIVEDDEDQQESDVEDDEEAVSVVEQEEEVEDYLHLPQLRRFEHCHILSTILEEEQVYSDSESVDECTVESDVVAEDILSQSSDILTETLDNSCDDTTYVNSTCDNSQQSTEINNMPKTKKRKSKKSKRNYSLLYSIASL